MVYRRDLNKLGRSEKGHFRAFHQHEYYKNDKKIGKDEYFSYVKRRLKRSIHPVQINDFFFLKMPDKFKNHKEYDKDEFPVDWLLANIVEYFWNEDIMTMDLDQGDRNYEDKENEMPVSMGVYYNKKALKIIEKMKVEYVIKYIGKQKAISIKFNQSELPRIYKELGLEIPSINEAFTGALLKANFLKNNKIRFMNMENEFSEIVHYPDFFEWKGDYNEEE